MAREVVLKFTANVTSLRTGMMSVAASMKDFEGQVVQVAKTSSETQRIAGRALLGVGVAAAAGLALAVRSAVQFEQRMRNVATISGDVEKNFGAAGKAVLEMSGQLGVGANELAEGLYDVASSGFQGAAGMQILETAATAAQAGLSTTATAARAITGALNAYGLAVGQAGDVSDIFFQTVNLGIVTFEELAQNVGDFMGTANTLGIALDQASAAFATITLAGVPAAEAATSLNAVMTQMLSPSVALVSTLKTLGYETAQSAVEQLGLVGTLQMLRTSTGDNQAAFAALFPEIRAMRGALALTAQDGATYNRVAGEITDKNKRAGAAADALAIQQKSLAGQLKIAKEQIVALAIGVGQSLLPVLRPVVGLVRNIATGFAALGGGAQTGAAALGILGAGVLTLAGGFLLLAPKIAAAVTWFRTLQVTAPLLAASLTTVTVAMGVIGAAMIVATGVLAAYGAKKRETKARTDEFVQALKDERAGIEGAMEATVAKTILDKNLDKAAAQYGISLETLTRALLGNKDAQAEVNQKVNDYVTTHSDAANSYSAVASAADKFTDAVGASAKGLDAAQAKLAREDAALKVMGTSADGAAGSLGRVGDAAAAAAAYVDTLSDSQKALLTSLQGMVDLSEIYVEGQQSMETAEKAANRAQADRIREGAQAQRDAIDARHDAERRALEGERITGTASQKAHDQRMKDLQARHDAENEAADATVESEGKRAGAIEDANTRSVLSLQAYIALLDTQAKARINRMRNLAVIRARGAPDEVLAELASLPAEYSGVIAEIATTSEAGFDKFLAAAKRGSADAVTATQAQFDLLPTALGEAGRLAGKSFSDNLLEQFRTGAITIEQILKKLTDIKNEMIPVPGMPGAFRPRGGGNVATLAEGHVAQIAPAGSWRVWAEPETGGEAYIPLAPSKRGRSMALLTDVAGRFGHTVVPMAAGGTWGVPASGGSAAVAGMSTAEMNRLLGALERTARRRPARVQNVFNEKVDPLHVARKISWALS